MRSIGLSRKRMLIHMMYESEQISIRERFIKNFLDELILDEFESIQIEKLPLNRHKRSTGSCYVNAIINMNDGEVYVDGYAIKLDSSEIFQHAWNIDINGSHVDDTLSRFSENYLFKGVAIPPKLVIEVGLLRDLVWGPVLPFLTDEEIELVREYNVYNQFCSLKF